MIPTRRDFLKTFGLTTAALAAGPSVAAPLLSALESPATGAIEESCRSMLFMMIRALPSNTGDIFIAPTPEMAKDRSKAMRLRPGEFVEFEHFGPGPTVFLDKSGADRMELSIVRAEAGDLGKTVEVHVE
jgi:hypothetical protein